MTAQEAKDKGIYEGSIFKAGFTDINTDGNGVLSDSEICARREKELKPLKVISSLGFNLGVFIGTIIREKIEEYRKEHVKE